jgi:hypothetical protein
MGRNAYTVWHTSQMIQAWQCTGWAVHCQAGLCKIFPSVLYGHLEDAKELKYPIKSLVNS